MCFDVTDPKAINQGWGNYFKALYTHQAESDDDIRNVLVIERELLTIPNPSQTNQTKYMVTEPLVKKALSVCKNTKHTAMTILTMNTWYM